MKTENCLYVVFLSLSHSPPLRRNHTLSMEHYSFSNKLPVLHHSYFGAHSRVPPLPGTHTYQPNPKEKEQE